MLEDIERHGFSIVPDVTTIAEADALIEILDEAGNRDGIRRRGGVLAIRNLLELVPAVADLAASSKVRNIAQTVLGERCFAVRGILFDKTPDTNWKVSWHQDLTIAVKERSDVEGFGPWSEKSGVVSVQPPVKVLEAMITVRINLDECGPENGPVRVIPGSHLHGRLSPEQIEEWRRRVAEVETVGPKGAALVMRPLLLHASSPAVRTEHRRIIHMDFAKDSLPAGVEWFTQA